MSTERLKIRSRAPTRIDLAGGTLDIWPLFLFLKNPVTINIGIDLFADVLVTECLGTGKILIKSDDQTTEFTLHWGQLDSTAVALPALELPFRLLRKFYKEKINTGKFIEHSDLTIQMRAKSPGGAGLGGSSSLNIALTGALAAWARGGVDIEKDSQELIRIARDIETQVIQVPAGLQDYFGAMYGSLHCLHWGAGSHWHEKLPASRMAELGKRLLLFYSGQSRNSGMNNWVLFKNFIDNSNSTRDHFQAIVEATLKLEDAIKSGNWVEARAAIEAEWEIRRTLAPGICTPQIEAAFNLMREEAPHASGKVCGAGGGGCFFVFFPDENEACATGLRNKFIELGIQPLPFEVVSQGLKVQVGWE